MIKLVTLFLIFIMVLGLLGRLRWPRLPRSRKRGNDLPTARKCPSCGGYVVGPGPCHCGRDA